MSEHPTYRAHAVRSGRWWAVDIREVPGAFTQARRLDQVETMARDMLALLLQSPPDSFDVAVDADVPEPLVTKVEELRSLRERAAAAEEEAARTATALVSAMLVEGFTVRDAGRILGISYQRASQLARRAPRRGNPGKAARVAS